MKMEEQDQWPTRVCAFLCVLLCATMARNEEAAQTLGPESIIIQLQERAKAYNDNRGEESHQARGALLQTIDTLSDCGESAIPVIAAALTRKEYQAIQGVLLCSLAKMPSASSSRFLVSLYRTDPSLRPDIEAAFRMERIEKHIPMGFRLSDEELRLFHTRLQEGSPLEARGVAEVLSVCNENDISPAVEILVKKIVHQVQNPDPPETSPRHSSYYLPRQIVKLGNMIQGIGTLDNRAVPTLWREKEKHLGADVEKWLTIALGFAGDRDVAPALTNIVMNDPDLYVRYEAITAYARSACSEAITLLETFKDDTTVTEYGHVPLPLLQGAAREAIATIESGKIR